MLFWFVGAVEGTIRVSVVKGRFLDGGTVVRLVYAVCMALPAFALLLESAISADSRPSAHAYATSQTGITAMPMMRSETTSRE